MKACMGGFCRIRAKCPNYTEADRAADDEPAERLCWRGHDGAGPLCEIGAGKEQREADLELAEAVYSP